MDQGALFFLRLVFMCKLQSLIDKGVNDPAFSAVNSFTALPCSIVFYYVTVFFIKNSNNFISLALTTTFFLFIFYRMAQTYLSKIEHDLDVIEAYNILDSSKRKLYVACVDVLMITSYLAYIIGILVTVNGLR